MINSKTVLATLMATSLTPALAFAAEDAAGSGDLLTQVLTGLGTLAVAAIPLAKSWLEARAAKKEAEEAKTDAAKAQTEATEAVEAAAKAETKATAAEARAKTATDWADKIANAHSDGVVLLVTAPGTKQSCRAVLEINGWNLRQLKITEAELKSGDLLPGPGTIEDVREADAVVLEGFLVEDLAKYAELRDFRDNLRPGCGVILYTGGENHRYGLEAWGDFDVPANRPVTAEGFTRESLSRRALIAKRNGVRAGGLAEARAELKANQG